MNGRKIALYNRWLCFVLMLAVLINVGAMTNVKAEVHAEPDIKVIERFDLIFGTPEVETVLIQRLERVTAGAREVEEIYAAKSQGSIWGYLTYDTYSFKNGDLYYYLKYETQNKQAKEIQLIIPFAPEQFDVRTIEYPIGLEMISSVMKLYENQTSIDNVLSDITPGSVYIDSLALHGFFSYTSVYEKRPYQIREELYEESKGISTTAGGIMVTLPSVTNSFSEQWGIISLNELVNWENRLTASEIRVADLSRIRKWGGDGQYYVLPKGYSPYSPNGFYRNNANHIGDKFIRSTGGMFEDFGYVTMDTLVKTRNADGFWGTSPISDWLYKDYKIGSGFLDTRWDTEAAFSLLKGYRRFNEPQALEAAAAYADFYCGFAASNAHKTKNGGLLVYDYGFNATPGIKTHVSLNHLVNEMNFLMEMYITTENETYLDVVDKILIGIKDTSESWINKANGDLYYAYYVNGRYGSMDYPTLTLNDLRYAQSLIKKVYGEEEAEITKLIDAKENYLETQKIVY